MQFGANLKEVGYIGFDILREFILLLLAAILKGSVFTIVVSLLIIRMECANWQFIAASAIDFVCLIFHGREKSGRTCSAGIFNVKLAVFVILPVLF